jgi:hypothetical protein
MSADFLYSFFEQQKNAQNTFCTHEKPTLTNQGNSEDFLYNAFCGRGRLISSSDETMGVCAENTGESFHNTELL